MSGFRVEKWFEITVGTLALLIVEVVVGGSVCGLRFRVSATGVDVQTAKERKAILQSRYRSKVEKAPVFGVVTYNDKPVEGATVMFHYEPGKGGGGITTVTDAEGKYSAEFPVGTAKVSITKQKGGDEKTKSMTAEEMEKLMGKKGRVGRR